MEKKKPRVDKRKNIGKVAEVLAKNPNKTVRELAKETNLGKSTTARAVEELGQTGTKDPTIAYIVGSSKNRLKKVQAYFDRYLDEAIELDALDDDKTKIIAGVAKDDLQRVTVLGGAMTDDFGGLKDLTEMTISQLEEQRRLLLGQ